jgi:two-component system cell cycle response regulator DivK
MTASTILIIEDNPTNLKLVSTVLKRLDCRLLTAVNGEQGVEIARQYLPDLVLMDMQLPGISGIEATRQLKTDPATSSIQIVALTAHTYPEELDAALIAGCSGCITKPIDTRAFPEQIRQFLPV